MAYRDAVWTVPGSSKKGVVHQTLGKDGKMRDVPWAAKGCDTSLRILAWKFGQCDLTDHSLVNLKSNAVRFSGRYASERGLKRYCGRITKGRSRAPPFALDSHPPRGGGAGVSF